MRRFPGRKTLPCQIPLFSSCGMTTSHPTHSIASMDETIEFCALVVEQAITFLDNLATLDSPGSSVSTKEIFERKSQILPNSVIGRHLRHIEGRIAKVLDASERQQNSELLSYEGGKHIEPFTSPSISEYQAQFLDLRNRLVAYPESALMNRILIRRGNEIIESTTVREIYAAAFHAIHHFAIMGALLREMLGAKEAEKFIPAKFGFKPKTGIKARL